MSRRNAGSGSTGSAGSPNFTQPSSREDEALRLLRDLARETRQQPAHSPRRQDRSNKYLVR